ncbi:D-alanyl-D-alanine carboxypeptidase/D-alanyl-D-alanine-endopeptidase [Streptomyces sp. NPDC004609]|uniref:D-alanyl-D-alanine carboxypeptidase/D-alanyl-D-alanine endopeptidase n=1 Tax=Streptomyces sp. NPDC004609 TaxID=3364704 RepID=UPI0036C2C524
MPVIRTWQLAAGATVVGLALAAGAVAAAGPWDSGQRKAERDWAADRAPGGGAHHRASEGKRTAAAPSAPGVLTALGSSAGAAAPGRAATAPAEGLARELGPLLRDRGLGPVSAASVVDMATGREVYGTRSGASMVPASTTKIATTSAALSALGPDHRIPTTVVASGKGAGTVVTLVGGGDASLDGARLGTLADRTASALRAAGPAPVRLAYSTSLYRGKVLHPIGVNGNLAEVTPLMVDQGRLDPRSTGPAERSGDPAGDAARAFGRLLEARGVAIAGGPASGAPAPGARQLARVLSPPVSELVERTLTDSDNDIAESLARQTAIATGEEASFAGAGRAVKKQLARLKVPLAGTNFADGSGLDRKDRVSARLLTALLARAAEPGRPGLRPVLTGLPVAGFTGTLDSRYPATSPGAGLVRAKTGTLTGVNSLSGTVVAPDGRLLAFAFLADRTPSRDEAQLALDRLAAALVS